MNSLTDAAKYFAVILAELAVLFLSISTVVALMLVHIPKERIRDWMSKKGILANIIGAFAGALTPFCACSTIPLTLGFLKAGITFGSVMSFLIASPLLNPIILAMLVALMGWRVSAIYFITVFLGAIVFGLILEGTGGQKLVKNVRIKEGVDRNIEEVPGTFNAKLQMSFSLAWRDFRSVLPYQVVGVAVGAAIYGYLPQDLVLKYAGPDRFLAVPIAAVIGVPLYIRAESLIAMGVALMHKGMSVGAVIALVIGGAGMAIPEMSMLASIFHRRLVFAIVAVIFLTAVIAGYTFNVVL